MRWLQHLTEWFRGSQRDAIVAEELEAHRQMVQDELERQGLSPRDAAAESRRRLGNVTLAREDAREVWVVRWADALRRHIRYGARGLRREPGFAVTAIVTLALGTAATTTVFSVVDAEVWRPLPFPEPHRLVIVTSHGPEANSPGEAISLDELQRWQARATSLVSLAAEGSTRRQTAYLDHAESLRTSDVTANYFSVLGRTPILGRDWTRADAGTGAVVITERGWERLFNRDPSIIGRAFLLDEQAVVIVGVYGTDDSLGPDSDLYVPIDDRAPDSERRLYGMIGRLAPDATVGAVQQQVQAAIDDAAAGVPARARHRAEVVDLSTYYRRTDTRPMYFFLGAAVLVLLLTIANVAGLAVSRALRRTPEFALRSALGGASRTLVTQLAVEGALVAVPGCVLGLVITFWAVTFVASVVPGDLLLRGTHIIVDGRAAAFALTATLIAIAGFVIVPLGIIRRAGERLALGSGARAGDAPSVWRSRQAVLVAQLSLTVMLLVSAGLFVRSFIGLTRVPLGFVPSDGWSLSFSLTGPRFQDIDTVRAYVDDVIGRIKAVSGVTAAAVATSSPLNSGWLATAKPHDETGAEPIRTIFRSVGPEYFTATGTRIVRGRGLTSDDRIGAPLAVVVNEAFARRAFAASNPIGRTIDFTGRAPAIGSGTATIVGVAANIKEMGLNEVGMGDLYMAFAQKPSASVEVIVRAQGDPATLARKLRDAAADPLVPVTRITSLQSRVDIALQNERFNLLVVAGFALLAVTMAGIGIYGAMAYATTARAREFGVRLALGATPGGLLRVALTRALGLGLAGGVIGVGGAVIASFAIGNALYLVPGEHNGLLYGTKTTDPLALLMALAGIIVLAIAAGLIPARRASKTDPVTALRAE